MIVNRIRDLRSKLNNAVKTDKNYEEIYNMSKELDDLILQYYRSEDEDCWKSVKNRM